jgi:hypothetical protein
MQNPFPTAPRSPMPAVYPGRRGSTSDILFGLGVVLLVFGSAITGDHHWNVIGLALIVFSSLVHLD